METELDIKTESQTAPAAPLAAAESSELHRREFIKRFGAYSAGAAVGFYVLMAPGSAKAGSDLEDPGNL